MNAELIFSKKRFHGKGIIEMVIWKLPTKTRERPHGLKYRLVYVVNGERLVGYDNEQGKGDHKHIGSAEIRYSFAGVDILIADFLEDVRSAD